MTPGKAPLLIRADASQDIGTGHVMRSLALAQAWQENSGKAAIFAMAMKTQALESRLRSEGQQLTNVSAAPGSIDDAAQTAAVARREKAAYVVIDGYHFGAEYQHIIRDAGLQSLIVDDFGRSGPYQTDVLLNQNMHANESLYAGIAPHSRLLLGPRYTLLRREFWPFRGQRRKISPTGSRVLVTLGGTDPDNVTLKVSHALQQVRMSALEAIIVVGGSNLHYAELKKTIGSSGVPIRLEHDVASMSELMLWADLAISAGGSTCLELAFLGLPNLIIALDEQQLVVARALEAKGVAVSLGTQEQVSAAEIGNQVQRLLLDINARSLMAERGQGLIDGKGGVRVMNALTRLPLTLRKVRGSDCEQLWKWVNDPDVRRSAFRSDPISWGEHQRWFFGKLQDPNCILFIALDEQDIPVGQIRFDIRKNNADVDVSIDKARRGLGYGSALLRIGMRCMTKECTVKTINAFIKPDNEASKRTFRLAGFTEQSMTRVQGCLAAHLRVLAPAAVSTTQAV